LNYLACENFSALVVLVTCGITFLRYLAKK